MKKAFTLVELLIVVVVLVTLMTMTFRLSSIGSDSRKRNVTVDRLNRLENCLSGYYAAYGSYPPVKVHGSRNIYLRVDSHGIQNTNEKDENTSIWGWYKETGNRGIGSKEEGEAWRQVRAACRSQPVGCKFPFPQGYDNVVAEASERFKSQAADDKTLSTERKQVFSKGFNDGVSSNLGRHDPDKTDWRDVQLFQFGLLSYLLPRYLVMMHSEESLYTDYNQWLYNNTLPCDPFTGERFGGVGSSNPGNGWAIVHDKVMQDNNPREYARVSSIPSQSVTARWLPNLEGTLFCAHKMDVYGLDLRDPNHRGSINLGKSLDEVEVYVPGGYDGGSGDQYVLAGATMHDGWENDFYYYSPSPHQNYTVWSAGPNGRTFPPWISRKKLDTDANRCVSVWTEDDIIRMSN